MTTRFHLPEAAKIDGSKTGGFRSVRTYGEVLLVVLLVLHIVAFFAYRWFEYDEVRSDLATFVAQAQDEDFDSESASINRYPNHIIVLRNTGFQDEHGYFERRIGGVEYLLYAPPGSALVAARAEAEVRQEIMRVGAILVLLYLAELIVLYSWWALAKEKIKELFDVS
jgi:hypothetical protein